MKFSFRVKKYLSETKDAFSSLLYAAKHVRFWVAFVIAFLIFGYLISFLQNFSQNTSLLTSQLEFTDKIEVLVEVPLVLGSFFTYFFGVLLFFVLILQSICIALLVFSKKLVNISDAKSVRSSGFSSIIIALGLGCPSCGTSLLAPLVSIIFGSSSLLALGWISNIVTTLALLICLWTIRRLGYIIYLGKLSYDAQSYEELNDEIIDTNEQEEAKDNN